MSALAKPAVGLLAIAQHLGDLAPASNGIVFGELLKPLISKGEDVTYVEHHYGTFEGREPLYAWITETMHQWPNSEMKEFPHDWCVCDEERGWWICR